MNMNEIADFLKSLRKSKGLTQVELADMLNVSNKTVSKWENGVGIPEMSTLLLLSEIYEVSVDDILRGSKKMHKDEDKAIERFQYLLHKSKHQYINHLIMSVGFLFLGILSFAITQALTKSKDVVIAVTIAFALISIVIQILNIARLRYQLFELHDSNEHKSISKMVLNSSFLILFLSLWLMIFVFLRSSYWVLYEPLDALFYSSVIPAFAIAFIQNLMIYIFVRISLRTKFDASLTKIQRIFGITLLLIIVLPFAVIKVFPIRDVAIAVDYSGINQSIYQIDTDEDRYYQLKLLSIINESIKEGDNPTEVYDIVMMPNSPTSSIPAIYYHFTEPHDYELYIELSYFNDFLSPVNYSDFEVDETTIKAYWSVKSDEHLTYEVYGYLTGTLLSMWCTVGIVVFLISKQRKKH